MSKYVVINSDGTNAFYDSTINTTIPSTALSISEADHTTFFSSQGSYIFTNINGVATLTTLTDVYFASDYGMVVSKSKSNVSTPSGSVRFTAEPTSAELKASFPAVAGCRGFTVNTAGATGDTVSLEGAKITCGSSAVSGSTYLAGGDASATASNIYSCLSGNSTLTSVYDVTISGTVITLTEVIKGNGSTPSAAVTTGSITISSGTATSSVWGYSTSAFVSNLKSLEAVHTTQQEQNLRGYSLAQMNGNPTTSHKAEHDALESWFNTKKGVLINEQ
jgi:hypothetical protein